MNIINKLKNLFFSIFFHFRLWVISIPRRNWVSYHAQKLIKDSQKRDKEGLGRKIIDQWFTWMHPNRWRVSLLLAFTTVLLPQLVSGFLFRAGILRYDLFNFLDTDFLSNSWQVLASILGISFVIVVFLTEYSQDKSYERRAFPLYVSATAMIFIVMVGLLTLMSLGINLALVNALGSYSPWVLGCSLGNSLLFFINLALTLILYIRSYQLLNPGYFRKILIQYHRKQVLRRVYQELFKRLKQNICLNYIESLGIQSSLFRLELPGKAAIKVKQSIEETHIVSDVNLDLIDLAVKQAKKIAGDFQKDKITFGGIPGNTLSKENLEIALVSPDLNNIQVVFPLQKAIRLTPWRLSKLESASEDLLINRDLVSIAISSGQAENVETSLNLYLETIEAFLDALKQLGHRFTPELAEREGNWFNQWDIFDTVHQQFVSLLKEAMKSSQSEIINEFVSFPSQIMRKAFQYKDHFAFRRFANLYPLIYSLARRHVTDRETGNQIIDQCGRLLVQFSRFWLESPLSKEDITENETKDLIAYGEYILIVLNQLAKYQIDYRDSDYFRLTIGSLQRLFNEFCRKHDEYALDSIESQIKYAEEDKKADLNLQLQKENELNQLARKLDTNRYVIFIGLGTWICHLVDKGLLTVDIFNKFAETLGKNFQNLNELHKIYSQTFDSNASDQFNWRSWEMDEWTDETYGESTFGTIGFYSWISLYYTLRALELTPENPEAILEIDPTPNIKGTLDSIKTDIKHFLENKNWEPIVKNLGDVDLKASVLLKSHETAYKKQLEIEEIELIQSPLSGKKIQGFCREAEEEWEKTGSGRSLFKAFGRLAPRPEVNPPEDLLPFGYYQRIPKGVFIEHPQIGYPGWGRSYGEGMSRSENAIICAAFQELPLMISDINNFDQILVENIIALREKGLNPLVLYGSTLHGKFFESKNYEPRWRSKKVFPKELEFLDGFFYDTYVFRFPVDANSVVIYDPTMFGDFVQYKVDKDKSDFPLSVSVKEISDEKAKKYIVDHPELKKKEGTEETLSEEEAVRKLQQTVELAIWQRFRIENVNKKAGVVIKFESAENIPEEVHKKT